jgi:hypothetical protein
MPWRAACVMLRALALSGGTRAGDQLANDWDAIGERNVAENRHTFIVPEYAEDDADRACEE